MERVLSKARESLDYRKVEHSCPSGHCHQFKGSRNSRTCASAFHIMQVIETSNKLIIVMDMQTFQSSICRRG
jgi:hypothetical protein